MRLLVEEGKGRGLDAVGVAAVKHRIQVHRQDLLFRIVILQHHGRNPLFQLRDHQFGTLRNRVVVDGRIARVEIFGQLLRNRAAAALIAVAERHRLDGHAGQRNEIDPGMGVETHVFGRRQGRHQCRGKFAVIDIGTVLDKKAADHLPVLRIDFGSQVAFRVLELFESRQFPEYAEANQQ